MQACGGFSVAFLHELYGRNREALLVTPQDGNSFAKMDLDKVAVLIKIARISIDCGGD